MHAFWHSFTLPLTLPCTVSCSHRHDRLHDHDGLRTAWDWVYEQGDGEFTCEEWSVLKRRLLKRPSSSKCAERIASGFDASGSGAVMGAAAVEVEEADSDGYLKLQRKLVLNFQQQDRRREVFHFTGRCTHSAPA